MHTQASNGQRFTLREVLDGLRDNFVATFKGSNDVLTSVLADYDRAVSETILDLLDTPEPPQITRKRKQIKEMFSDRPGVRGGRVASKRRSGLPKGDATVAEVRKLGVTEDASKQTSIDDVVGQPA